MRYKDYTLYKQHRIVILRAEGLPNGEFKAVIRLKSLREMETLLLMREEDVLFENEDTYFTIIDGILYTVRKKKRSRKTGCDTDILYR